MTALDELLTAIKKIQGIDVYTVPDGVLIEHVRTVLAAAGPTRQLIYLNENQIWWRGHRLASATAYHSSQQWLMYHPDPPHFNRASGPGEPTMYASRNWTTVACELGLKTGDLLQLIFCRVKPGLIVKADVVGEFEAVANSGISLVGSAKSIELVEKIMREDPELWDRTVLADAFCADLFSQRIPKDRHERYKPTACIAWYLLQGQPTEALMFPSVQKRGGMNVAVPNAVVDAKFEMLDSWVVKVRELGYGQFGGELMKASQGLDGDTIIWAPQAKWSHKYDWTLAHGLRVKAPDPATAGK
jgi:RES domain.